MLVVISPAKRLDMSPHDGPAPTTPDFQGDAVELAGVARGLTTGELQKLMGLSDKLARLNAERFADFAADPAPEATRPAAFLFDGDTYAGLEARTLDEDALRWAQDHLRILSGLYGMLRPLDAIQPYRLEMGSRLANARGKSLYDYWGDRLAKALNAAGAAAGTEVLVNCASTEYFGAVDQKALQLRVITPVFMEERNGQAKIVSFYAKKARGAMARFICENRLTDPQALKEFDTGGYRFSAEMSEDDRMVFLRTQVEAAA
ncbi:peroxide stress protein YaaA [Actibacterium sp. MT2.3-13A]|uniref:peroxide stress protein YaaA n=1 Tax=Actibacterium sp. MT2.3-13A TaxID=2828332 RepID=UPI001BAD332D|nr:peroxide stress protein YaaA [Actibacterium sp. MT2.3-13A]